MLVDLQGGANVEEHPALGSLKGQTGATLIDFLSSEGTEILEEFGIDETTIALLKRYEALFSLFALAPEDFRRFIDSYERWLTPETARKK